VGVQSPHGVFVGVGVQPRHGELVGVGEQDLQSPQTTLHPGAGVQQSQALLQ
jgi:hypothetical protein